MNNIILTIIFAGFGAQLLKIIIFWFKHKRLSWHDIIVTGGMPSSHSAFVVSLATSIYLEEGTSTAFAISLVLAFIVLRDAFGVRRTVGEEGVVITQILKKLKSKTQAHFSLGHTPLQVVVGAVLGLVVAIGVHYWL
ncbi:MAG TPA: divergent PAP2 family protein [Candidatus Nanoarchaeia archaeon]|nr:divergent PAP2 family protein [Candidatus Nanoarchaeia archaeon]